VNIPPRRSTNLDK
jgi:hypothetical protein